MSKKYKLGEKHPILNLYRVVALVAVCTGVKAGDVGGWVESEKNLDQSGNAWVSGNAQVYGNARVYDNARVYGNTLVYDNAQVSGNTWVYDNARVYGNARVYDNAQVSGNARVYGNAKVERSTHYFTIGPIGSRASFVTIHADAKITYRVNTGCFSGSIEEFKAEVEATHGDGIHAKEYHAAIALAELHFKLHA